MRQIVTGTGRSGTGYVSAVVSAAGLPMTHELRFGPGGPQPVETDREASWMAVPYLHWHEEARRVLVWREPEQVISSFLGIGFFAQPSPWLSFWQWHIDQRGCTDAFQLACTHYVVWNRMALRHCDVVTPLHAPNWQAIMGSAYDEQCIANAVATVPTDTNARSRAELPQELPRSVHETRDLLARHSA